MKMSRIERDSLGEKQIPSDALYGIHALRAKENFPGNTPFPLEWYRAVGIVKLACYNTYMRFSEAAIEKYGDKLPFNIISSKILNALCESAREIGEGNYFEHFIVPAVQGGAGTSINMNINEIIANSSLIKTGKKAGDYNAIDPIEHANIYQSTNDVIPSALTDRKSVV
jgi:aspartate ammonia-lyase